MTGHCRPFSLFAFNRNRRCQLLPIPAGPGAEHPLLAMKTLVGRGDSFTTNCMGSATLE